MQKKQKPTKEYTPKAIYESYYWLITQIDPYNNTIDAGLLGWPACVHTAIAETGKATRLIKFANWLKTREGIQKENKYAKKLDLLVTKLGKGELTAQENRSVMEEFRKIVRGFLDSPKYNELPPFYSCDKLLSWHVGQGILVLHTKADNRTITCVADIKRVWKELELKCSEPDNPIKIEAYLALGHRQNLKKLEAEEEDIEATLGIKEMAEDCKKRGIDISERTFRRYIKEMQYFPAPINPNAKANKQWKKQIWESKGFSLTSAKHDEIKMTKRTSTQKATITKAEGKAESVKPKVTARTPKKPRKKAKKK